MLVKESMTPNPITVEANATLPEIAALMREKKIRRVPVLEHGKLVGIISDHDIMANMPSPATTLSRWEMNSLLDQLLARDFMTHPVYVTSPNCSIESNARFLLEKKIGALPVMEGDQLVGIITESDIFRTFAAMLSGGGEPGLRFTLRAERQRGLLAALTAIINDNGGRILALATLNEADGVHKQVMVKETGGDTAGIRAALDAADIEVLDVRDRNSCNISTVG
ncbi:MAG: CBS domain-containing protein [Caldilineales bacterium]|nr:CBS domain-containing protein [Caldilineales bacterium]